MNVLERIQSRLGQSSDVMSRASVRLYEGYAAEHDARNAIWRCVLCRHGDDCRDWLAAGRTDIPDFCPNREIYERHRRPLRD